jgi:hypothetical protein
MHKLYTAHDLIEAQLIRSILHARGIEAVVANEALQAGVGELPMVETWPEVWICESRDWDNAVEALRSYEQREVGSDWTCTQCQEINPGTFDVCWACVQPLADEEDGFTA